MSVIDKIILQILQEDFDRAKDLYKWNKFIFAVLGVWPLQPDYIKFTIWIVYFIFHLSFEFTDFYNVFGNLGLMILNLLESTLQTMIIVKLMVLRFSRKLVDLMIQIISGIDAKFYESGIEKEIYMNYNRIAKKFFKLWTAMGLVASIIYHMKPLEFRLRAVLGNESMPFVLPYHTRFHFDVNDSMTFWFIWILQIPIIYIHMFHAVAIAFLFSLVLHVCGQLAVLAFRIKNLDVGTRDTPQDSKIIFRDIVERHGNIIRIARDIDDVFHLVLMEELLVTTVILGLTSYSVILNSDFADKTSFITFLLYGLTMLLLIYGYCVAGEYLIVESTSVYDAYYQFQWYDLSNAFKKQLIICMIGASRPLHLTAGGYYTFSLASFTNILKTSASAMSMLRKIV